MQWLNLWKAGMPSSCPRKRYPAQQHFSSGRDTLAYGSKRWAKLPVVSNIRPPTRRSRDSRRAWRLIGSCGKKDQEGSQELNIEIW